ncbi:MULTISPECIES: hypothetical protein [Salipiger]
MTTLNSALKLGGISSVIAASMTETERRALNTREISLLIDPAERAQEYPGVTLRDRVGARVLTTSGCSIVLDGSTPALDVANVAKCIVDYTVGASYFVAVAVDIDTLADTGNLISSSDTSDNRLFFGLLGSAKLRIDHGGTDVLEHDGVTLTGQHVFWASYDAVTGAAALGMDAVTPAQSGTFSGPHKGTAQTWLFGGDTGWGMDGRAYLAVAGDRYLGGDEHANVRAALLSWCAERNGVALAS